MVEGGKNFSLTNCSYDTYYYGNEDELLSNFLQTNIKSTEVIYIFILCVGCLANLLEILMLLLKGKNGIVGTFPSSILVLFLGCADFLFLFSLPFSISQRIDYNWSFGAAGCKLVNYLKFFGRFASIFFLVMLALDRYLAVKPPHFYKTKSIEKTLRLISGLLWLLAAVVVIPIGVFSEIKDNLCTIDFSTNQKSFSSPKNNLCDYKILSLYENDYQEVELYDDDNKSTDKEYSNNFLEPSYSDYSGFQNRICHHSSKPFQIWIILNFILGFIIPFVIMFGLFYFYKRKRNLLRISKNNLRQIEISNKYEKAGIKVLFSSTSEKKSFNLNKLAANLVVTNFICWAPFHIWHLLQIPGLNINPRVCFVVRDATFCMAFFNSALNPLLTIFFLMTTTHVQERDLLVSNRDNTELHEVKTCLEKNMEQEEESGLVI